MIKYDQLWQELNCIRAFILSDDAINIVDEYYKQYKNTAPGEVMRTHARNLQQILDNGYGPQASNEKFFSFQVHI